MKRNTSNYSPFQAEPPDIPHFILLQSRCNITKYLRYEQFNSEDYRMHDKIYRTERPAIKYRLKNQTVL
jgi:hypothetical protein